MVIEMDPPVQIRILPNKTIVLVLVVARDLLTAICTITKHMYDIYSMINWRTHVFWSLSIVAPKDKILPTNDRVKINIVVVGNLDL